MPRALAQFVLVSAGLLLGAGAAHAQRIILDAELETRYFFSEGEYGNTDQSEVSIRLRGQISHAWANNRRVIVFIPYALFSDPDGSRTHADVRELAFSARFGDVDLIAGISRVFWGVTESVHLVNIVNQTDAVEDFDGEEKLGQSMLALSWRSNLGTWSLIALPFFRERRFPGGQGRLRPPLVVDRDATSYAGSAKNRVDLAARWAESIADFDIGVSHFYGTNREPILTDSSDLGAPSIVPTYGVVHQSGLDFQMTRGALLLKHESVFRHHVDGLAPDFYAQATGLEFTTYAVGGSASDLGWLAEYLYASQQNTLLPFDNDVFLGVRWAVNDIDGSELLAGIVVDLDGGARFITVETRRRLSPQMFFALDLRQFLSSGGPLEAFAEESHVSLKVSYQF